MILSKLMPPYASDYILVSQRIDGPAIGIDLGTSYCCAAIYRGRNRVEIIPDEEGNRTFPSYVAFINSEILVGH